MHAGLWVLCLVGGLICTGFLYQVIGSRRDRQRFTGSGRWVTIGSGCKLYLLEKGSGGPTVLFEAGIAATNLNWFHIQESVACFTSTASYDRSGLGWSSPSCTARTPWNIAIELHEMLQKAGIKPPYILVGHSFGGLIMRRYALMYPEDVASVLLVDPMRCEEWPPINAGRQSEVDRGIKLTGYAVHIARFGIARLAVTSLLCRSGKLAQRLAGVAGDGGRHILGRVTGEVGKMPKEVWPIVAAHWSRPGYYAGVHSYVRAVPDSVREMQNAAPIKEIPVMVLTPGRSSSLSDEHLCRIGNNVEQVIAPASAHWIHLDDPDLVIDSIRGMVVDAAHEAAAGIA